MSRLASLLVWGLTIVAASAALTTDSSLRTNRQVVTYIGHLTAETDKPYARFLAAFDITQPGLRRVVQFEYVIAPDDDEAGLADKIKAAASHRPAVLVAPTGNTARIARRVAADTPVVFASFLDPVRSGIAGSMRLPGGHVAGVSLADWLDGKRLEILRDAFPHVRTVAVLTDKSWAEHYDGEARIVADARRLGLDATVLYADATADVDRIMSAVESLRFDAWYVLPTYVAYLAESNIAAHLRRMGKPSIFCTTTEVASGGDIGYAQDESFVWSTVAELVARVVAGEDPGTIPVERPRRYVLAVRVSPEARHPPIAPSVVRRADFVY
ncbi:hypothetical protein BH11PSE9_BH11PSE9_33840 [soil metagenome]